MMSFCAWVGAWVPPPHQMVSATGMALFAEMLPLPHMKNLGSDLSMIGKIRNEDDTNPAKLCDHHCPRPPCNIYKVLTKKYIYCIEVHQRSCYFSLHVAIIKLLSLCNYVWQRGFTLGIMLSLSLPPEDKMEKKKNKKLQALGLDLYYNYKFWKPEKPMW